MNTWWYGIIEHVMKSNPGLDSRAMRVELNKAFPYGECLGPRWKEWCNAVNYALTVAPPNDSILVKEEKK